MTIKFFLSSTKEFLLDEKNNTQPVFRGYFLDKYILAGIRGESYPPGMDDNTPFSDEIQNLHDLTFYLFPASYTDKKIYKRDFALIGNRLSPSQMLAQRYNVFTCLQQIYETAQVQVNVYIEKFVGFIVQAPDWMSACVTEGFLLAALNSRPTCCPHHLYFHGSECPACMQWESLRGWLRQLKCREKIDDQEKKACLRQADTFSPDFAKRELREKLIKEGKLRGYNSRR